MLPAAFPCNDPPRFAFIVMGEQETGSWTRGLCCEKGSGKVPIYEYQCRICGHTFEMLRRIKDADNRLECPKCRTMKVERQFSTFAAGGCGPSASGRFT